MENKAILKNTEKYGILKLADGIDLKTFKQKPSDYKHYGISTQTYSDTWFVDKNSKQRAVFKTYDSPNAFKEIEQNRVVNEMLCQEIGKQISVSVAKYAPAHIDDKVGAISYDVAGKRQELVTAYRLLGLQNKMDLKNFVRILKDYCKKNQLFYDSNKMVYDLYKMMVFDCLTFQEDRRGSNIHFLINKSSRQIELSPLIDNELAFGTKVYCSFLKQDKFPELNSFAFLANHGKYMEMTFSESQQFEVDFKKRYYSVVKSLVKLSKKSPIFENFLDNAISNFDMSSAIKNVEAMGYQISDGYKQYLKEMESLSKQAFCESKFIVEIQSGEVGHDK